MDPTGEVDLEDPQAVLRAIKAILDRHYEGAYGAALLDRACEDLVHCYRGTYPSLLPCDSYYHDLRHGLEVGLTAARLIDAYASASENLGSEAIDGTTALLVVLLALYHDVGLLRRSDEANLSGLMLMSTHEERGIEFMRRYLAQTDLAPHAELASIIMPTKLAFRRFDGWSAKERLLGRLIATADLLSQCADRCYLEKCRDFLFDEYAALGLAGEPKSLYPDRERLLANTSSFVGQFLRDRLDNELGGLYRLLDSRTGTGNPWTDAIERSLGHLDRLLSARDFSLLRRHPKRVA